MRSKANLRLNALALAIALGLAGPAVAAMDCVVLGSGDVLCADGENTYIREAGRSSFVAIDPELAHDLLLLEGETGALEGRTRAGPQSRDRLVDL
jgi:hypothetical protein